MRHLQLAGMRHFSTDQTFQPTKALIGSYFKTIKALIGLNHKPIRSWSGSAGAAGGGVDFSGSGVLGGSAWLVSI